jgi:putative ABC transport system permease protein
VVQFITIDYFRAMASPLRTGREFTAHDRAGAPQVTIVSEGLARRLWPEYPKVNALGRSVLIGVEKKPVEVVGVVGDLRQSLDDEFRAGFYRPALQAGPSSFMFVVKTAGDPMRFVNALRREVLAIDHDQPISSVKTMSAIIEEDLGQRRVVLGLLGLFAGAAVLLTAIGIYGMVTYWVVQRTRELGMRRALGAPAASLRWLVVGRLVLTSGGVIAGSAGTIALTRLLQILLFQVSPTDPLTFAAVAALLAVLTLAASYFPAHRATRIDPMEALRFE